ncbi:hypothetical protein ABKN59_007123 [Abortiporus biennis]
MSTFPHRYSSPPYQTDYLESEADPVPSSSQVAYSDYPRSSPERRDFEQDAYSRSSPPPSAPRPYPYRSSPPRQPRAYREHDNRPVTPPPAQLPSPAYIKLANQSPSNLLHSDPPSSRKLLILDLNGTLLHRSAPSAARGDRPKDASGRFLPRVRPVHPRPYMPSFRNFLFAEETKQWLDTMVWSSAQPHSVNDMVQKTFKDTRDGLVAIWDRETLGLSEEHYNRKVQTFKDLSKPWAELPGIMASTMDHPSSPPSDPSETRSPSPPGLRVMPQAHSALTTLLLDDSPRKAELQPYNHICLPEYDGKRRALDLNILQAEKNREIREKHAKELEEFEETAEKPESSDKEVEGAESELKEEGTETADADATRKRKRKEKKLKKAVERATATEGEQLGEYDDTLIAIIGILDEIKHQANVASWIRFGGLWGLGGSPADSNISTVADTGEEPTPSSPPASQNGAEGEGDVEGNVSDASDLSVEGTRTPSDGRKKKKRQRRKDGILNGDGVKPDALTNPATLSSYVVGKAPAESASHGDGADADAGGASTDGTPMMWFENTSTIQYWANRGRKVLENMGIPLEPGIER